jgi:hypothetical protein
MGLSPILVCKNSAWFSAAEWHWKDPCGEFLEFGWKATRRNSLKIRDLTGLKHRNLKGGVLETHATRGSCHIAVRSYAVSLKLRIQYQLQLTGNEGNSLFSN